MAERLILTEYLEPARSSLSIVEGQQGRDLYLEGLCIQGEVRNHNGRVYPGPEIAKAVHQMNERIKKHGPVIGECDHPTGLNINLDRATHLITSMELRGTDGHGRIKIVPYGLGQVIEGLVRAGARLGVSSRGTGNVDRDGRVSDFDIVTIDVVANPSAPNAYPEPIYEGLLRTTSGREALRLADSVRHDKAAQKFLVKSLLDVANNLNLRKW
jgi:hypothetical protein